MSETRELPTGWVWTTLGELSDFVTSGSRGWARYYADEGPIFVRIGNLDHDTISLDLSNMQRVMPPQRVEGTRTRVWPDDILISITADLGMVAVVPQTIGEAYINQHIALVRLKVKDFSTYLGWYLASSAHGNRQLNDLRRGATKAGLGLDDIRSVRVPLPSIAEQRHIVAAIEQQFTRLDAGVAALRRARAALKRYRAAVLKAAVEGRLTEQWRAEHPDVEAAPVLLGRILTERRARWEADLRARGKDPAKARYEEPKGPDAGSLPELPEGWCWASLEQITSAARPICYGILMPKENVVDGVPYVKVKDMKGDKIDVNALHRTAPEIAAAYSRASLKPRDLLLAIRGTYGRVAEVPDELDGANITQDSARLDVSDQINHQYVATYLRSENCQTYFRSVARGVAVKGVNIADVKLTAVALPSVPEQEQIVAEVERRLSVVGELEATVEANLKRAERLRQSILREAFAGRLVAQETSDEPAGVLVERIRGERAETLKNGHVKTSKPEFVAEQTVEPVAAVQDRLW